MPRLATLALAAALCMPPLAGAQTQDIPAIVSALAPQLVNFTGSTANFQNLVNGLAQGTPVTLVALTADGFQQTATFTPTSALTPTQIAQTLEQARQALIVRGIAAPTPEQIGVSLLGGRLATPSGTSTVAALLPNAPAGSASTGASAPASVPTASNLQVTVRPASSVTPTQLGTGATAAAATAPTGAVQAPTQTSDSPRVRNTSDTPFAGNTSDTPLPPTNVPSASTAGAVLPPGSVSPGVNTSPAAQMQGRR
ncbi:MAG: hypothetical protein ACM30H_03610 [Clostridia bacterium]